MPVKFPHFSWNSKRLTPVDYDESHMYFAIPREAISKNIERNKINYLIRNPLKFSHNPQKDKRVIAEWEPGKINRTQKTKWQTL